MSLQLHAHPLSSYCQKALIGLYANAVAFEFVRVDLGDAASRARFTALWPLARMPVLRDEGRDRTIPEATIVLEYIDQHYRGDVRLIPADPELAWQVRLRDRFFDLHVQDPMQKIVGDRLRPADRRDPFGVEQARSRLRDAYAWLDRDLVGRRWAAGDAFSMADCAAAPALFYAQRVEPFADRHPHVARYFERLTGVPAYARCLAEAEPFLKYFPA